MAHSQKIKKIRGSKLRLGLGLVFLRGSECGLEVRDGAPSFFIFWWEKGERSVLRRVEARDAGKHREAEGIQGLVVKVDWLYITEDSRIAT